MASSNRQPQQQQQRQHQESQLIREALAVLNFHLRCSSIKLTKQIQYLENEHGVMIPSEYDRLAATASYQDFLREDRNRISSRIVRFGHSLIWLASNLFVVYASVRFINLAILHLKHDRLVERIWSSDLEMVATFDGDCSPFKHNRSHSVDMKELVKIAHRIDELGSPLQTFVGVGSIADLFLTGTGVIFYVAGFMAILVRTPRLNLRNFVENRHRERRRFQLELYNLVSSLFSTRQVQDARGKQRFYYTMKYDLFDRSRTHLRSWLLDMHQFRVDLGGQKARLASQGNCFVLPRKLHHIIRPAHLSDWWHQRVSNSLRTLFYLRVLPVLPALLIVALLLVFEIVNRVTVRLAEVKCNATMETNPRAHFFMDQLSAEHRLVYQNYDGSLIGMVNLFTLETWLQLTILVWFNHFLAILAGAAITVLVPLYSGIYIYDYGSKMLWLTQIERQVDQCMVNLTDGIRSAHGGANCEPNAPSSQRRQESLKLITLAYLNYELFRREQRNYQSLTNILTMQMFVMNINSLVTCYYLCSALKGARNFVSLALVTYIAFFLNSYFIMCAIRTSKILKLMKNICRLAAFSVDNSLRLSPIVQLWSHQLLPHHETMSCFAPKLLGISLSFDKIVTFNAYLVALWLFAIRE